jgi:SAM-dependent methyltransferase
VRRVRDGLELRVEGTLASLRRPGRALTGVVWWALAAPVLLVERARPRVLLLGLGGGSVARALRELAPAAEIVGVERDARVLRLARRHFGLDRIGVEAAVADALAYLRRRRRRYDLIVEDLFVGPSRSVRKPEWLLGAGYRLIRARLRAGGVVVSNTIHETAGVVAALRPHRAPIVSFDVDGHWNRIVVCGRRLPSPREIRSRLRRDPLLERPARRFAIRSLFSSRSLPGGASRADRLA